jgi:hypothetical protein
MSKKFQNLISDLGVVVCGGVDVAIPVGVVHHLVDDEVLPAVQLFGLVVVIVAVLARVSWSRFL